MQTIRFHPPRASHRWIRFLILALLLTLTVWLGHDLVHHLPGLELWIADHGWLGWTAFIVLVVVLTSMFVPDTLFAVAAGAIFGLVDGAVLMVVAAFCTASLDFVLSRVLLRNTVNRLVAKRPRLTAIRAAVEQEGLRFQFLLRLTPVNPVTISYVLGVSNTHYPAFLAACTGMIPTLAVEVYFGHAARHAAVAAGGVGEHSPLHLALTLIGLALSVAFVLYLTQLARTALARVEGVPVRSPDEGDPMPTVSG